MVDIQWTYRFSGNKQTGNPSEPSPIFRLRLLYQRSGGVCNGRWMDPSGSVSEHWRFPSMEAYRNASKTVSASLMETEGRDENEWLRIHGIGKEEQFLQPLEGSVPRHIVSVFGVISDNRGEILLVRTYWRGDTWEPPGGQVEEGETLDAAVKREIREETGIEVELFGVAGVYQNMEVGNVAVGFRGQAAGGRLRPSAETREVSFHPPDDLDRLIRRPQFRDRIRDGLRGRWIPFGPYGGGGQA
ncbi:ADP-ribose pyrophosphatase YjhB (NUDIX family) [Melghirimyces profundicolus]|uniref:ADP-ribose pyrophosphatase YjhB (NUDIX family) n=1 Tax=Melghirimyces profundicolus TaxID=1242148 RepID=A0A2T6B7A1_9BACL|nr:NUDIX hydrolase [Melghirimyces profundicolus]PTX51925.1 ADP-ribose pyrophosphatase YjhB (NUDIX family) [Melghirimyces profundicolus]